MAAIDQQMLKNRASSALSGFSAGQRVVVVIAVATLVAGGLFFAQWASKPTLVPLFSNLATEDASAITTKLQSDGISYELADGGATVLVAQTDVYQARIDLAGQGLPSGGSQGYKLLEKQGITTSEFREHIDYQRALEGELSKTISAIQGVEAATVRLVIPKQDVFAEDDRKPSAAVLVRTTPGRSLAGGQVQAVVNLVASSVEGLTPEQVTVADATGKMLAAPGQGGSDDATTEAQTGAARTLEENLNRKVQELLIPVVGQGKAVVRTTAQLNFDKSQSTEEIFNPNNKPANPSSQRTKTETYENGNPNATGVLGPEGVPLAQGVNGQGNYVNSDTAQDNALDRTVTQTHRAPGSVDRLSVAVVLDSNVAGVDVAEIESIVTQAAGLEVARGDTVAVSRLPFDQTQAEAAQKELEAAAKAEKSAETMDLIKTGVTFLIVGVVLVVLFLVTRKRAAAYSTPISMAELDAAMPALPSAKDLLAAVEAPSVDTNSPEAVERAKVDREITDLIERQPDEVASLLRSWLADRRS